MQKLVFIHIQYFTLILFIYFILYNIFIKYNFLSFFLCYQNQMKNFIWIERDNTFIHSQKKIIFFGGKILLISSEIH